MENGNSRLVARMSGEVLTPREVAKILQLSYPTVIRRLKDKTIPATQIGDRWRISTKALDNLLPTS